MTLPTAATRLIALLGDPVSHSLSPQFQNAAFRETHVDGIYLALRCDASAFAHLMKGIAAAGGAGNVTLPHKALAAEILDVATPAVETTGACNTFWAEDDRVYGDNTDVSAFHGAVSALVGDPAGARVLLLGAGGAASAALYALLQDNVETVILLNRTPERAHALRSRLDPDATRVHVITDQHDLRTENVDLIVNASALGLRPDDPLPSTSMRSVARPLSSTSSTHRNKRRGSSTPTSSAFPPPTGSRCSSVRAPPPSSAGGGVRPPSR